MGDSLPVLVDRFEQEFSAVMNTREIPLAALPGEERATLREAEGAALARCRALMPQMLEDKHEAARQAAQFGLPTLEDMQLIWIRRQQMLEELQEVRQSEERCIARSDEPELLAAESKYRIAVAERQALLDQLGQIEPPVFDRCRYLGGYRHLPNPIDPVVLWFEHNQQMTYLNAAHRAESAAAVDAMPIPWTWINALTIESPEDIKRRVTATRAAAIGVFALAVKKRVKQTILVLETKYDDAFFEIDGYETIELRAQMSGWQRYFEVATWIRNYQPPPKQAPVSASTDDPLERIRKLAELKAIGLVSEQEFEEKRVALLKRV